MTDLISRGGCDGRTIPTPARTLGPHLFYFPATPLMLLFWKVGKLLEGLRVSLALFQCWALASTLVAITEPSCSSPLNGPSFRVPSLLSASQDLIFAVSQAARPPWTLVVCLGPPKPLDHLSAD